jgi:hypothetical protein
MNSLSAHFSLATAPQSRRAPVATGQIRAVILTVLCLALTACNAKQPTDESAAMSVSQLLCTYTPSACGSKQLIELYSAPPDKLYDRRLGDQTLRIPTGYISDTELLVDPRYPKETQALRLVALLPGLEPRTPANVREFFVPFDHRSISISVDPRTPGAIPWKQRLESIARGAGEVLSPIRRADKFGLSVVGEDFAKHPNRRPCASLGQETPACWRPHARDVLRPLQQAEERSLMICDPDILEDDIGEKVEAMSDAQKREWYESNAWWGKRRAICDHRLYYKPLDAHISMRYPRRFAAQWTQTERLVRELLDISLARGSNLSTTQPPATNR